MVRFVLLALLVLIALRVLWRVVGVVFGGPGYQRPGSRPPSVGLVRDPVCGTFILPSRALTSGGGAGARYVCSEKCRRDYAGKR